MRVLLVTTRFPLPPRRGQQVRTVEWMNALGGEEKVVVCPRPEEDGGRAAEGGEGTDFSTWADSPARRVLSAALGTIRGRPAQESLYGTGPARRAVAEALTDFEPDLVVLQMVRCAWALDLVDRLSPATPVLFDAIDSMGLHFSHAADGMSLPLRPAARLEAGRCRRLELHLAQRAAVTTAVSQRDLDAIEAPAGRGLVVPVAGREPGPAGDRDAAPTILLSGNLGYRPTVLAAQWFARSVWPQVRARVPDARWVLAGARPALGIRRLTEVEGVELHADVPDLGTFLARAWVAVAPMATGSGVPMKVLEAWAAGTPVVAHPWTALGLEGEGGDAVRQAEGAEAWAKELVTLLSDGEARRRLTEAGLGEWRSNYSPEAVAEKIRAAVRTAVG